MAVAPSGEGQERPTRQQAATEKLCRACKLPMPTEANKCTKCSSLQDWHRYLDMSGLVLSLLVALTSVLAFAIPIWKETLTPKIAQPAARLLEVDGTGLATLVVTNGGNAPALLEQVLFGSDRAVVRFDFASVNSDKRVVEPNKLSVVTLRLSIENTVDDVWDLVQIYRSKTGCELQAGIVTPDGKRTTVVVDASTAGLNKSDDEKDGCPLKLRKLSTMTLSYLGEKPEYVATMCKVAELHPKDPKNPEIGPKCKK
jgi:hypothetical protein